MKFDRDAKVLNFTHTDFDGVGCSIALKSYFKNVKVVGASFFNIDQKLSFLDTSKYDYVFITDIHPTDDRYLNDPKIILIDHHPSNLNNPSENRFVMPDKNRCAAWLVKHYIERSTKTDLSHLNTFFKYVDDYDRWIHNHPKSKMFNEFYKNYYNHDEFIEAFKDGRTRFTKGELEYLKGRRDLFNTVWDNLELFDLEHSKGCFCESNDFVNDIADKLKNEMGYDLVFVKANGGRISVRHGVEGIDIGEILESLGYGGGHGFAAGMFETDRSILKRKILEIDKAFFDKVSLL